MTKQPNKTKPDDNTGTTAVLDAPTAHKRKLNPGMKTWKKGQSGNPSGMVKGTQQRHMAIQRAINKTHDPQEVVRLLASLHAYALKGNVRAAQLWLEYTAGKPTQPIDIKGDTPNATATLDRMGELIRQYPQLIERMLPDDMRIVKTVDTGA